MMHDSMWRTMSPALRHYAGEAARQRALVVSAGHDWLAGRIDALRYRLAVRAARKELASLDARILADIGITRPDIDAAVEGRLDQDPTRLSRRAG